MLLKNITNFSNPNLSAELRVFFSGRRRREIFYRDRVEMMKALSEKIRHSHKLINGYRGADVGQHVSYIVGPCFEESVHPGEIDDDPHDCIQDNEDPCDDRGPRLLARIAQLSDVLVVVLQGVPCPREAAPHENRQAQLVYHHAVVDDDLDDRFRSRLKIIDKII